MSSVKAKSAAAPPAHPKYIDMAKAAVSELKERKGSSRAAIAKVIAVKYNLDPEKIKVPLRNALKKAILSSDLKRPAGTSGARGSGGRFKLGDVIPVKPKVKKVTKKPVSKTVKKPAAKKTAKPPSKKTATKKKAKSPGKAKTTKTATKKKTTTKKTAGGKNPTKKATKKPAAKKSPSKKPAAKK